MRLRPSMAVVLVVSGGGETTTVSAPWCGGNSMSLYSKWRSYGTTGLYLDLDTSVCGFKAVPQYVFSVQDLQRSDSFGQFMGSSSVMTPTHTSFRVILWFPPSVWQNADARGGPGQKAQRNWVVNWIGSAGRCCGDVLEPGPSPAT